MKRIITLLIVAGFCLPVAAMAQRRLNSVQSWVTPSDLPAGKMSSNQYVVTKLEYEIDTTGRVDKCRVDFSDMDSLGKLGCALVKERARYAPAFNTASQPVRSRDQIVIEWALPPGATVAGTVDYGGAWPIAEETWMRTTSVLKQTLRRNGKAYFHFRIQPDGRVGECVAAALIGDPDDGKYICRRLQENARFRSPVDERGNPYETIATMKYTWGYIKPAYDQ